MTALEYFRQFAPEFNNLSDEVVTAWLTSAAVFLPTPDPVTEKTTAMNALYAAHLCWMNKYQRGGHRGVLTAEQFGDNRRTYKPVAGSDTALGQSPYGMQFLELSGAGRHVPAIYTRFGEMI